MLQRLPPHDTVRSHRRAGQARARVKRKAAAEGRESGDVFDATKARWGQSAAFIYVSAFYDEVLADPVKPDSFIVQRLFADLGDAFNRVWQNA